MTEPSREQQQRLADVGRLVAGISHDLKNPLGVIKTSALLLGKRLEQLPDDPQLATPLARIVRSCRQAGALIDQLLEFTRVKNPHAQRIPLATLIDETLSMLALGDELRVEVDLEPQALVVTADPLDLSRVLANLIGNAAQSLEQDRPRKTGAAVRIRAREDRGGLRIEVIDNGPGVPDELRERIFEPLVTSRAHGTGLGLAISRELIEAHGGQLTLEPNPSGGARFVISLPLRPESDSE